MPTVLQAHLPGNYEFYDQVSNKLGEVLCKLCWEGGRAMNSDSLDTVWVSSRGWVMVWWVCRNHCDEIRARDTEEVQFIKSVRGVVRAPGLEVGS